MSIKEKISTEEVKMLMAPTDNDFRTNLVLQNDQRLEST